MQYVLRLWENPEERYIGNKPESFFGCGVIVLISPPLCHRFGTSLNRTLELQFFAFLQQLHFQTPKTAAWVEYTVCSPMVASLSMLRSARIFILWKNLQYSVPVSCWGILLHIWRNTSTMSTMLVVRPGEEKNESEYYSSETTTAFLSVCSFMVEDILPISMSCIMC